MYNVFIDGREGTTGLQIYDRLAKRGDCKILILPEEKRKDVAARKECINNSDVCFLCLPDDAAREAAARKKEGISLPYYDGASMDIPHL